MRDDCPKSTDGEHDFQVTQLPWPEGERLACRFCGRNTDGPATGYCRACDLARHICPGCGESIEHGENACADCLGTGASEVDTMPKRWWQFAVLRGDGLPAELEGRWFDLDDPESPIPPTGPVATLEATNRWEQRADGAVAVVYEWTRRT